MTTSRTIPLAAAALALGSILTLTPGLARDDEAPSELEASVLEVTKAETFADEDGVVVAIEGAADVPDGVVVQVGIEFAGKVGHRTSTEIVGKRFKLSIRGAGEVIPGDYVLAVALAATQPRRVLDAIPENRRASLGKVVEKKVHLGNPEEKAELEKAVRRKFNDLLEEARAIYLGLAQYESYFHFELVVRMIEQSTEDFEQGRPVPDRVDPRRLRTMRTNWENATEELWGLRFKNLRYDWKQYQSAVFMSPYPEAVAAYEALLDGLTQWYAVSAGALNAEMGLEPPEELAGSNKNLDRRQLYRHVKALAQSVYESLGATVMPQWEPFDVAVAEEGRLLPDGRTYESYVAKFRVALPGPQWQYDFKNRPHPSTRLRMLPLRKDPKELRAIIAVEVTDFPGAESMEDLARLAKLAEPRRFSNFKEIKVEDIRAPDPTMPGGKRPGVNALFTTQAGEGPIFWVRHYQLFCRWFKRVYSLVCIVPEGGEKEFERQFENACRSFRILDAPAFQKFKAEELRRIRDRNEKGGPLLTPEEIEKGIKKR